MTNDTNAKRAPQLSRCVKGFRDSGKANLRSWENLVKVGGGWALVSAFTIEEDGKRGDGDDGSSSPCLLC